MGLEDNRRSMQERMASLLQGQLTPARFAVALQWNLLSQGGLADLEEWLEEHPETRLIVIDMLARVRVESGHRAAQPYHSNQRTHLSIEDGLGMLSLKEMAERCQVAILLLQHAPKARMDEHFDEFEGFRYTPLGLPGAGGGIDATDSPDCTLVLRKERFQSSTFLHIAGRNMEEQSLLLKFDHASMQWKCTGRA